MSKVEDQKRLLQAKLKTYAQVAYNRLNKKKTDELDGNAIESNGTSRKKDIRLLHEAGVIKVLTDLSRYSCRSGRYKVLTFDNESKSLAIRRKFEQKWQDLLPYIENANSERDYKSLKLAGYVSISPSDLSEEGMLHYYWHQDEYLVEDEQTYPKDMEEERQRQLTKAVAEYRFQKDFPSELAKYIGLPAGALNNEAVIKISYRNFSRYPVTMTEEALRGAGGFLEEYEMRLQHLQALKGALEKTVALIEAKGGPAAVVEALRKQCVKRLVEEAPLHAMSDPKVDDYENDNWWDHIRGLWRKKHCAMYALKFANLFDYDYLYGDDSSIEHIDEGVTKEGSPREFQEAYNGLTDEELELIKECGGSNAPAPAKTAVNTHKLLAGMMPA